MAADSAMKLCTSREELDDFSRASVRRLFRSVPFWMERERESRLLKSHPVILSYQNTPPDVGAAVDIMHSAQSARAKSCAQRVTPGASVQYPWRMQPTRRGAGRSR